ncbi:hypothetical protein B0I37DRAFT_97574 [Chaetomium sp. MPI-CAGE-AT-0009]|nr:hypothetical protein B0I37DRAFT_97574 [Chaetomium sp. MPI-CAGE-AT-0009]
MLGMYVLCSRLDWGLLATPLVPTSIRNFSLHTTATTITRIPCPPTSHFMARAWGDATGLCIPGSFENFCRLKQVSTSPPGASVCPTPETPPLSHQAWADIVTTVYTSGSLGYLTHAATKRPPHIAFMWPTACRSRSCCYPCLSHRRGCERLTTARAGGESPSASPSPKSYPRSARLPKWRGRDCHGEAEWCWPMMVGKLGNG